MAQRWPCLIPWKLRPINKFVLDVLDTLLQCRNAKGDLVSTNPEQDTRKSSKTYKRYPIHAFFFPLSNSGLWVGLGDPPEQVLGYCSVNTWAIHAHIYIFSQFTVKSPNPLNCGKKLECLPKKHADTGKTCKLLREGPNPEYSCFKVTMLTTAVLSVLKSHLCKTWNGSDAQECYTHFNYSSTSWPHCLIKETWLL